jgi:ABC-type lipoprotein release transport system permease subunit
MLSILVTAWRLVVKRALADWLILLAALVTIVLATTLLAAGPIYADAVTLSAVRRTLNDAAVTEANVQFTVRATPDNALEVDERVRAEAARAFNATGGVIYRRAVSESYALPEQPTDEVTELVLIQAFEQLSSHATLVEGAWPQPTSSEPYAVAISEPGAAVLGLQLGDTLQLTNRREQTFQPTVQIVGIYSVNEPSDPYWFDDTLDTTGVLIGESFNTYGPMVTPFETLFDQLTPGSAEINWRIFPTIDNLETSEVVVLRRDLEALPGRVNYGRDAGNSFRMETGLIEILRETERSLLVTRSGVLILIVQLAILAGYALLLTAGLLVEQRRIETALLRSRGADNRQVVTMALMEGLLLAVPTALLAPWLAALALRSLNYVGPLAAIDLHIDPVVTDIAYLLAGISALLCVVALTVPALRSSRSFTDTRAQRGRQEGESVLQRAGIDLALLALAAIGFWQLRRYGAPITETVQGRLGIDPLLVAAPAIGLLAGAIVALRTIPLLARLSEGVADRGTRVVPALGAWQVARRPLRYARSGLLLMLAIAIGLFAVSYSWTWRTSQADQADFQVGSDIRVNPDRRFGRAIPELTLTDAHMQIDGVETSMPVARQLGSLSRSLGTGRFILLDAAQAPNTVIFRDDLAEQSLDAMMAELAAARPELATIDLPGTPQRLAAELTLTVEPRPEDFNPEGVEEHRLDYEPSVNAVLQDGEGLLHRVRLGPLNPDGTPIRIEAPLVFDLGDGNLATPIYPLALVSFEITGSAPEQFQLNAGLVLDGVQVSDQAAGDAWTTVPYDTAVEAWETAPAALPLAFEAPGIDFAAAQPAGQLALELNTGSVGDNIPIQVTFVLRPSGTQLPDEFPIIVSQNFLALTETSIGATIPLRDLPGNLESVGRIVGTVESFPTVDPSTGEVVVMDLPTLAMLSYTPGQATLTSGERWMSVDDARAEEIDATLRLAPYSTAKVFNRFEQATTLRSDPVALGTLGALSLGFVAAAIFAAVGFTVSAAVSARERLTEFALLRALGLSPRQLAGWLSLEHSMLVVFSLVMGTILGLLLAWLVLPLIAITQAATQAVPDVIVVYPWLAILALELAITIVLVIVVVVMTSVLRRIGLGTLLRIGEE